MLSNTVIVDTDVWSHLFAVKAHQDHLVHEWKTLLTGKTVVIATQTRAELLAWPRIRNLGERRQAMLLRRIDSTPTIPVTEQVVQEFARLTATAKKRGDALGQKVHVADRWVAAALALDIPLLARDTIYANDPGIQLLWRPASS